MQSILNLILPSHCLLCRLNISCGRICTGCVADIQSRTIKTLYHCQQCALPLLTNAKLCGDCLQHPPSFKQSFIPYSYEHPVDYLIQQFKYNHCRASSHVLASLLGDFLHQAYSASSSPCLPEMIIPTPLHWQRRFSRGFNQTMIIACELALRLNIPVQKDLVQRSRHTLMQKGLSRKERITNMKGAFCIRPAKQASLENKVVAVLDDVVTTTTTIREISRTLKKAGAAEIHIWALARTPGK